VLALPWNVPSLDARKTAAPAAQGRPYALYFCEGGLDIETEEYVPSLLGHDGKIALAETANATLKFWNSDGEELMFDANVAVDSDFSRDVVRKVGWYRFGVSVEVYYLNTRFASMSGVWCKVAHHATLSHVALLDLDQAAFPQTWVKVQAPKPQAAMVPFRNSNPHNGTIGGTVFPRTRTLAYA
jgi:hypothetical protein